MSTKDHISIILDDPAWKRHGVNLVRIRAAARLSLVRGRPNGVSDARSQLAPPRLDNARTPITKLTILLTGDLKMRELNARFRGKDRATNVLSFPAAGGAGNYIGDVAIALGVATSEATSSGVDLEAHTLHLAVHGILHLLGYDHTRNREAKLMERLETDILKELGLPSPYARSAAAH